MSVARLAPEPAPRRVTVLGSTGSIGQNTLDLVRRQPEAYRVVALTAHRNVDLLIRQALEFRPAFAAIADSAMHERLAEGLGGSGIAVGSGAAAVVDAAALPSDWLMAAIVGAAGLEPTLTAVRRGTVIALANKECLVCAGELMLAEVATHGATLLPVDSEHNAIFQVFDFARRDAVERIVLTASGGPFRAVSVEHMAAASPAQAIAHPNWDMGAKISVDSATMMNKGLELIEAHYLFGVPSDRIDILVHPQSVIHSMVSYIDGSVLAQLGTPDMRTPIAHTLAWPDRVAAPTRRLDLAEIGQLTFERPDPARFPALRVAREALRVGDQAPIVMNAANEIAVEGFLGGRIGFLEITRVVERTLEQVPGAPVRSLQDVREFDAIARRVAGDVMLRSNLGRRYG